MKNRIGLTASMLALGGACAMATGCASTGRDSALLDDFNFCRDIDNGEKTAARIEELKTETNKTKIDQLKLASDLQLSVKRAEDCRQWYYDLAGVVTVADATESTIASGGGLGLLAYGGAAASTNVFLATLVVGPEVFREVTRQEPQGVLAYQAAQATTLAECQLFRVREGLHAVVNDRVILQSALSHARRQREALTASIETFLNEKILKLPQQSSAPEATPPAPAPAAPAVPVAPAGAAAPAAPAAPAADIPFGQLVAQNAELKELVGLARRYDELIAEGERLLNEMDLLTAYIEPSDAETRNPDATPDQRAAAMETFRTAQTKAVEAAMKRIDQRLATDLNTKVDAINLIWSNHFQQLTPTPGASLRSVLAAPFSFTAKLIAGEEMKSGDPEEVARATYDFSASYGPHGVKALSIPTVVVAVDKAVLRPSTWSKVDNSLDGMRALSSAMSRSNAMLTTIASVDSQAASGSCRLTPSSGVQTRSPQAVPPSQPADAPILVMAKG